MSKRKIIMNYPLQKKTYLLILLALIITISHQSLFFNWTNDDAFISYRYTENLCDGKGLVFNSGEKVEGYSNFLWIIVLAPFKLLGLSPLLLSKIISFCISMLLIFLLFRTAAVSGLDEFTSCLCALTLSFSSGLAYFSMSGLETVFYTFLLLLCVLLNEKYEKEPKKKPFFLLYGVLLAVALARPEGILFLLISSGYHILKKIIKGKGIDLKKILLCQLFFFASYAIFVFLRYWYYSDLLPNTFYAKPKGTFVEQGYSAFYANFTNALLSGSFLLIPVLFLLVKKKSFSKYLYPLLFCIGQLIFMSYTGDWMAFGRFFLPILPIVLILFFSLLGILKSNLHKANLKLLWNFLYTIAIVALAGLNLFQTHKTLTNKDIYPYLVMNSSQLTRIGKWLKQNFPPETVITLRRQGAIPYYSKMKSIDILGLTEKEIARTIYYEKDAFKENEINAEYVLNQRPDVLILFSFKSDYEGWMFDESEPQDRLFHIEYLLYEKALQKNYKHMKYLPLGKLEKAHFLVRTD
jgi:arabinofuranosyltransferase